MCAVLCWTVDFDRCLNVEVYEILKWHALRRNFWHFDTQVSMFDWCLNWKLTGCYMFLCTVSTVLMWHAKWNDGCYCKMERGHLLHMATFKEICITFMSFFGIYICIHLDSCVKEDVTTFHFASFVVFTFVQFCNV